MRKKKALALLMSAVMLMGAFTGCGSKTADTNNTGDDSQAANNAQSTSDDVTELEFWTFVELHGQFYQNMAAQWNEKNPDKKVNVNVNVMPYDDMHNKLQIALTSGEGAPDFVDIEQGKFANFTQGTPALMDLTEAEISYSPDWIFTAKTASYTDFRHTLEQPLHFTIQNFWMPLESIIQP